VASEVHGDSVTVRPESRPRTVEVLGAQGEPVAGALVRWWIWPVGVTGSDGRISVSLPGEGDPPLLVEGPGGERAQVTPDVEPVAGVLIVRFLDEAGAGPARTGEIWNLENPRSLEYHAGVFAALEPRTERTAFLLSIVERRLKDL
jgi:hypothetical protein